MRKVLVTGAAGYIGSVLVRQLLEKQYQVFGLDILNFGGESLIGLISNPKFKFVKADLRNIDEYNNIIKEIDGIVHLAAIVGDPACSKQPDLAKEINWEASKNLFDLAKENKNIKRFIFASTCSNYGKMEGEEFVNEESPLKPVSLYAELKVKFEKYLFESKTRNDFIPTALRFATVYGISSRMRFDLTVNEFIREIATGKELVIFGEQFWRPYTHVEDLARGCIYVFEADPQKADHNVFNVGDTSENYSKRMIAEEILKFIPEAKIKYVQKNEDPRDYRVDFTKIKKQLNYSITKTVPKGLREIYQLLKDGIISDPYAEKYKNI